MHYMFLKSQKICYCKIVYNLRDAVTKYQNTKEWMKEVEEEMFYLMMHPTNFIYGYMASDIW